MGVFPKRYHPPGTLAEVISEVPPAIRLIDYTDTRYDGKGLGGAADRRPLLERDSITWIHVQGSVPCIEQDMVFRDRFNRGYRTRLVGEGA